MREHTYADPRYVEDRFQEWQRRVNEEAAKKRGYTEDVRELVETEECVAAIQRAGLPVPPKSACFFCPSSKRQEIVQLRQKHPDLYERAIAMEARAAPNLRGVLGLGRRFSWKEVDAPGLDTPIDEPCGCWDGESAWEDEDAA